VVEVFRAEALDSPDPGDTRGDPDEENRAPGMVPGDIAPGGRPSPERMSAGTCPAAVVDGNAADGSREVITFGSHDDVRDWASEPFVPKVADDPAC
jgi:hypothetical protein